MPNMDDRSLSLLISLREDDVCWLDGCLLSPKITNTHTAHHSTAQRQQLLGVVDILHKAHTKISLNS